MSILSGKYIHSEVEMGNIEITPFAPHHLNPASYDLTLGEDFATYNEWVSRGEVTKTVHDVKIPHKGVTFFRILGDGVVLLPGVGYLMHTRERVRTDKYVPVIDGKSSIGRLFVQVHVTAGYGDPGFDGQYTLEVVVTHPIRLYAGMRIAQVRFHTIVGDVEEYAGNYTGEAAMGPVPSKAWKQFQ